MQLIINPATVRDIIQEARIFDAKEEVSDPDSGSNGADDGMVDILEDLADDSSFDELSEAIRGLAEDEQVELVALTWIGRGTFSASEWKDGVSEARRAYNNRTAEYLTSLPKLGDYLEEGLAAMEDVEEEA